jgi:Mg2+ and Co2+ transporter CorA
MTDIGRVDCIFCEDGKKVINLTESNKHFLSKRIRDGNINEAITISRIAWDNFPILKESADAKKIVEPLLKEVQQTINAQILTPINTSMSGLNALISTLEKNPELIQKCSDDSLRNLTGHLNQIVSSINGPTTQIQQIHHMLSQLIYKPSVKGSVGEKILEEIWLQYFSKDLIEMLGGAGREDFLVTPYLNNGVSGYGERISIERKSGKQTYTGAHFKETVQHAIEKGATYALIVYDTQDNLPQKTMFAREKGVLVAAVDIQSGTWKMAREIFEVLQKEITSKRRTVNEINIRVIQEVATDIGALVKYTSDIKGRTAKIQRETEKIDEVLDLIRTAVGDYQSKLKGAVAEIENEGIETVPLIQQVEPGIVSMQ